MTKKKLFIAARKLCETMLFSMKVFYLPYVTIKIYYVIEHSHAKIANYVIIVYRNGSYYC